MTRILDVDCELYVVNMSGVMRTAKAKQRNKSKTKDYPPECVFCGSVDDNEEMLGKRLQSCGLTVHYFCMLLSSGLCQRGRSDKDGILGFLPKDIKAEVSRGKKLTCHFCKKRGATIGCTTKACRISFHLLCGRINGTLHHFFGNFGSYCPTHRPKQAALTSDRLAFFGTANTTCAICICTVEARASDETLRSPCCRSSWFHRECIQRLASTAGLHFFKCPLCNNKDVFQEEMLEFGIYVPDQDAAWEMVPNAYQELLERYSRCDFQKCLCPHGREYNKEDSKWEIVLCVCCGSQGVHIKCQGLSSSSEDWTCPNCDEIASKVTSAKKTRGRAAKKANNPTALREELKKDYEKLQAKATGNRPNSRPLHKNDSSACDSPGTSGLQSPSCSGSPHTPRQMKYPETLVRITPGGDEEDVEVNVTSSDDGEPLANTKRRKAKTKANKCLGVRDSSSGTTARKFAARNLSPEQPFLTGQLLTSGLQSPSCSGSPHTPRQINYPETSVRITSRGDEDVEVNVTSSDDDTVLANTKRRKAKTKAKRCLGARDSTSGTTARNFAARNLSPEQPFPIGQLSICVQPLNVLPGTSVSVSELEEPETQTGKRKYCSPRYKGERPKKKHCESTQQRTEITEESSTSSSSVECSESFTNMPSMPATGSSKPETYRLSPQIIQKIKAPQCFTPKPVEIVDDSELSCEEEVSFREPVSPLACRERQSRSQSQDLESCGSLTDAAPEDTSSTVQSEKSLKDNIIKDLREYRYKSRVTRQTARTADMAEVVGVEEFEVVKPQQVQQVSSTILGDPKERLPQTNTKGSDYYSWLRLPEEPEYITVESPRVTRSSSQTVSQITCVTDDVQTISSASDQESDEEVIFLKSEKTARAHHLNGHKREWITAQPMSQYHTARPVTHTSTLCATTSAGQILMLSEMDQVAMPTRIGKLFLGTQNIVVNKCIDMHASRPASNTRSQQNAVVIDLTDSSPSDETETTTFNSQFTSKQTCHQPLPFRSLSPVQLNNDNNILGFNKAVSPLKIHEGRLESIRSAVNGNKMPTGDSSSFHQANISIIDLSDSMDDFPVSVIPPSPPPSGNQGMNKLSLKRNTQRDTIL